MEMVTRTLETDEMMVARLEHQWQHFGDKKEATFFWQDRTYRLLPNGQVIPEFRSDENTTAKLGEMFSDIEVVWKRLTRQSAKSAKR